MNFGREDIKKNKSLVEEVGVLQKTVSDEQVARAVVEDKLKKLEGSVSASDELSARLVESERMLMEVRAEVASLKEQVANADIEKVRSDKVLAEVRGESEKRLVRRNVALVGRDRAEKLTRSLVTASVNAIDAVIQQSSHEAVNRLRQG